MSPATSTLGSRQTISTAQLPCVFVHPVSTINVFTATALYNEQTFQIPTFSFNLFLVLCRQRLCIASCRCQNVHSAAFPLDFVTLFRGWTCWPHAQPQTWRTRVSLLVWITTLSLSGMEGPTSSIRYRQHISRDHLTTQALLLRQSRDTFGGQVHV